MKQSMNLHFFRQSIITGLHFPEDSDGHQGLNSEYILPYSFFFFFMNYIFLCFLKHRISKHKLFFIFI